MNVLIADTAGQEQLKALSNQYYKKADGILLVYDITNQASFDEIKNYYSKQIKDRCKFGVKVLLLGNKTDLEDERKISLEMGVNYAVDNKFLFMETSSLKNKNVAGCFETLIELAYLDVVQKEKE